MSDGLRCLLVDNDEDFLELSTDLFEERLADQGVSAQVTPVRSAREAREALRRAGAAGFDLVMTDMLFEPLDRRNAPPSEHVDMGSEIIRAAVRSKARFVVGYTKSGGDMYAALHADARRAGAHFFCTRQQLTAPEHDTIFDELVQAMRAHQRPGSEGTSATEPDRSIDPQRVAVVYGANSHAVQELFAWLRAVGLKPVEFHKAVMWAEGGSPPITEVLDSLFANTQAVIVLLSPDECVRLHPRLAGAGTDQRGMQARPNVYFEAGMAWVLNRQRTILLWLGNTRQPSDLSGLHAQVLNDNAERREELYERLDKAGCKVERSSAMFNGLFLKTVEGLEYEPG